MADLWEWFLTAGEVFGLVVLVVLVPRLVMWGRRYFTSLTSIYGQQSLKVTDLIPAMHLRAEPVGSRWWNEPRVWMLALGLLCIHELIYAAALPFEPSPQPHPALAELGMEESSPPPTGFHYEPFDFVMTLCVAIWLFMAARAARYTIDDSGVRRKRYFGGEFMLRWEDMTSVEIVGDRPLWVIFKGHTSDGSEVAIACFNGFYRREAMAPVLNRLLGRCTVVEDADAALAEHSR